MSQPIQQGGRLGRYQLITRLATGGMAEVWLGRATGAKGFQKTIVVKTILPHLADDPEFLRMFIDEALLAAALNHPNIVQIFDLGQIGDHYFIAMEYILGRTMRQVQRVLRKQRKVMPPWLVLRVAVAVCDALDYAHNRRGDDGELLGIVHRDVTPENIMISFSGVTKVVDFGIAKATTGAVMTRSGKIKGKLAYLAPEQIVNPDQNPVDRRTDIYALGVVLYEMLTGVRPFRAPNDMALLLKIPKEVPTPPCEIARWVPTRLSNIVMTAMAKDPHDRHQDAGQLGEELETFLTSVGTYPTERHVSAYMCKLFGEEERRVPIIGSGPLGQPSMVGNQKSLDSGSGVEIHGPDSAGSISIEVAFGEGESPAALAVESPGAGMRPGPEEGLQAPETDVDVVLPPGEVPSGSPRAGTRARGPAPADRPGQAQPAPAAPAVAKAKKAEPKPAITKPAETAAAKKKRKSSSLLPPSLDSDDLEAWSVESGAAEEPAGPQGQQKLPPRPQLPDKVGLPTKQASGKPAAPAPVASAAPPAAAAAQEDVFPGLVMGASTPSVEIPAPSSSGASLVPPPAVSVPEPAAGSSGPAPSVPEPKPEREQPLGLDLTAASAAGTSSISVEIPIPSSVSVEVPAPSAGQVDGASSGREESASHSTSGVFSTPASSESASTKDKRRSVEPFRAPPQEGSTSLVWEGRPAKNIAWDALVQRTHSESGESEESSSSTADEKSSRHGPFGRARSGSESTDDVGSWSEEKTSAATRAWDILVQRAEAQKTEETAGTEASEDSRSHVFSGSKVPASQDDPRSGAFSGQKVHMWDAFIQNRGEKEEETTSSPFSSSSSSSSSSDERSAPASWGRKRVEEKKDVWTASRKDPATEAAARFDEGLAFIRQGRREDALRVWKQAVELDPENKRYQSNLRMLRKATGEKGDD